MVRNRQDWCLRAASCCACARLTFGMLEISNGWACALLSFTYSTSFDSKVAKLNTVSEPLDFRLFLSK